MIQVPLDSKDDQLKSLLEKAAQDDVLLMSDGRPVGVLIGFGDDDDWFDYQIDSDPRIVKRIEEARAEASAGKVIGLEELKRKLGV
jgi:hypothetical protein